MMGWPVLLIIYLDAHLRLRCGSSLAVLFANPDGLLDFGLNASPATVSIACSVFLQMIYIAKFFYWESGYAYSMDV